jgi:hypothetical protein
VGGQQSSSHHKHASAQSVHDECLQGCRRHQNKSPQRGHTLRRRADGPDQQQDSRTNDASRQSSKWVVNGPQRRPVASIALQELAEFKVNVSAPYRYTTSSSTSCAAATMRMWVLLTRLDPIRNLLLAEMCAFQEASSATCHPAAESNTSR